MKKKLLSLTALIFFVFISCKNSIDEDSCDLEAYAQALINLNEVRSEYVDNPSTENCNSYRFALQTYISIGENCDQYESFVEARRRALNNLSCD